MSILPSVLDAIGNTPLIRLKGASEATGCEILGKAEFLNPGQSVKDRAALSIIRAAERSGALRPNSTRTGCALSHAATFSAAVSRRLPHVSICALACRKSAS